VQITCVVAVVVGCDTSSKGGVATSGETVTPPKPTGSTCTPNFTAYQPGATGCSADHTVCWEDEDGPACHGGAIMIPCGESGERCGKTFHCDCGDAGPEPSE
jgi:hypothetical protein